MTNPVIIQGGMGIGVSNWRLAKAVSQEGQLGVVSGTAIDNILVRRLQDGDPGGHMTRACGQFPDQALAERVRQRYFIEGGKPKDKPYKSVPMVKIQPSPETVELLILANFVEVYLAKEGHSGLVGINFLEKIQLPILPSLYGAMLAGVDYVLMGAGIPKAIPGILDGLSRLEPVSLKLYVEDKPAVAAREAAPQAAAVATPQATGPAAATAVKEDVYLKFDPKSVFTPVEPLKRPKFIAIVSSHTLAANLSKKSSGKVDGFVVENHTAGGHNAPPRGTMQLNEAGEPVYGVRDEADFGEMRKLGVPFWLAGGMFNSPESLKAAIEVGAAGVQIGTPFAFCEESGIADDIKTDVLKHVAQSDLKVFTDPVASTSGYPFKVVCLEGTLSDKEVYEGRQRVCDLGYLRTPYRNDDQTVGLRCPGEPLSVFEKKGGDMSITANRKCLCNGLLATVGQAQLRGEDYLEPAIVTAGDHILELNRFIEDGKVHYPAKSVIDFVLGKRTLSTLAYAHLDKHGENTSELAAPV